MICSYVMHAVVISMESRITSDVSAQYIEEMTLADCLKEWSALEGEDTLVCRSH